MWLLSRFYFETGSGIYTPTPAWRPPLRAVKPLTVISSGQVGRSRVLVVIPQPAPTLGGRRQDSAVRVFYEHRGRL